MTDISQDSPQFGGRVNPTGTDTAMGMYTEIFVNVDLKKKTPEEVLKVLRAICSRDWKHPSLSDKPPMWAFLFSDNSHYTPLTHCGMLTFDSTSNQWSLLGKGDIKNAGDIEAFFEWIAPWVDGSPGDFIGYKRYEEDRLPTLVTLPWKKSQDYGD